MRFLRFLIRPRQHDVTVVLHGDDVEFGRRRELRNAIITALEQTGLGRYVGGGSMVTGEGPNYELQFRVIKKARALAVISHTLRSLNAGLATELCVGSRTPQKLYDNAA